jgi:hypothetical protein
MITAFSGSKAAELFLFNVKNWRWGFGMFAIIVPVICAPLFTLLKVQLRKAEQRGLIQEKSNKDFLKERFWKHVVAFDRESPSFRF